MPSKIRLVSYANVVASLALFVALGGGAYAATQLPKNSVGAKQIKKNAVRSSEVKNRSLRAADFKAGQLPRGAQGIPGMPGAQGPQGPKGDAGGAGRNGATNVTVRSAFLPTGDGGVACLAGEVATGGGMTADQPSLSYVAKSEPTPNSGKPTGWVGSTHRVANGATGPGTVYVICASP